MTLPQTFELFRYWDDHPPEHEMLRTFALIYTTWKPSSERLSPEEEQRESLEARWKAGALNPKQMFESMGGAISLDGRAGERLTGANLPGIGPFPGAH
jgi:hypothetical protein